MVFTFLAAQGHEVGKSLLEADQVDTVRGYLADAAERGVEIVLPTDVVAADAFAADAEHDVVAADAIPDDRLGLDIGPETARLFADAAGRRPDGVLERPDGRVRAAPFAERHPRRRRRRSSRLGTARSPSSAAATPPPRCAQLGFDRGRSSATSPPVAARAWSTSRARSCPAWPFWRTGADDGTSPHSR